MSTPTSQDLSRLARLRNDLEFAGREIYRLRDKAGNQVPFVMNASQRTLHEVIEAQRAKEGWVRIIVLKGRQQGISTYTAARFYHRSSMNKGVNTYILAHEQSASDTLFGIVDRYHRNNPFAPHVDVHNTKELTFDRLDSSYAVATAGNKGGGRGKALTLFHGSEVAYWLNAKDHFASSVQGVPLMAGTEIILESTSAGAGGEFYERYIEAEAGKSDYRAVFLPWWLADEYQRDPAPGFYLSNEAEEGELCEQEYSDMFKLDARRMAWRRGKLEELRDPVLFRKEYPAMPSEAWVPPAGITPFMEAVHVMRARKRTGEARGPLILGVDPASNGGDRFSIAARRGHVVQWVKYRNKIGHEEAIQWIKEMIDELKPARVNIDQGNIGANIVSSMKNLHPFYANLVRGVNFGGTSQHKLAKPKIPGPFNRRAEMWARYRDWLKDEVGAVLPDQDDIQSDSCAPKQIPMPNNDFRLESKEAMKARGVRSPDLADSIVLTFASTEFFEKYHDPDKAPAYGSMLDRPQQASYSSELQDVQSGDTRHGWLG